MLSTSNQSSSENASNADTESNANNNSSCNLNSNLLINSNDSIPMQGSQNPFSVKPMREIETPPYWCPRCKQHVQAEFRTSGQLSIGQRLELSCKCGSKMLYKSRTDRRIMLETI